MQGESEPSSTPSPGTPRGGRGVKMLGKGDASLLGLGTQMLSEVAAGILLGLGVDYMLGTEKRWLVVGSIVGVIVAMWTVIRTTIRLGKQSQPRARPPASQPTDRDGGEP